MADRANILFILTDQQSATMMSCAGNGYLHTPAIDSIAAHSVRFERAYCTNPVCVPSRFSLMTGLMPSAVDMLSNSVAHIDSIPESIRRDGLGLLLRKAGYDVAYAGKVHLPRMSAQDVGFDYVCRDERDLLAQACADFLRAERDRPFCLVASFINPHDICYMAIRDSVQVEAERSLTNRGTVECKTLDEALKRPADSDADTFFSEHCPPLPSNFEPQSDEPEAIRLMLEQRPFRMKARLEWDGRRWREHRWAYARLTERVDAQIAVVLDALKTSGHEQDTLVVFTSDHGDMDASHRMEHKSALYEEVCRIPLIIRPPGPPVPGRVEPTRLVSNGLDLLPTFCDYAGVETPEGLLGRSLRPLVEGVGINSWRQVLPIECAIGRAVVTERYKYAVHDLGENAEQLIDLASDPGETRNALDDPPLRQTANKMRELYVQAFGAQRRHPADVLTAAAQA